MELRKKGFTLAELVAVLVIMAIIALIVTPLILTLVNKAKASANKRSVDAYGKALESSVLSYLMDNGEYPEDLTTLIVEYTGKVVTCNVMQLKENGAVYLSECSVGGIEVKDDKTEDGWYHYNERDLYPEEYVDMYGDALTQALQTYSEENGSLPEDYTTLELDYEGKDVSCDVTINYDGSIYLTKCIVDKEEVTDSENVDGFYHYGALVYTIGDTVTYNGIEFYVISPSDETSDSVTLLKAEPLTVDEVNTYGVGHVNMYNTYDTTASFYQKAYDFNGYGGMLYYSSSTCGYSVAGDSSSFITSGCTTDYTSSEIKYVVDNWSAGELNASHLKIDELGYTARLLTLDELIVNLGYTVEEGATYVSFNSDLTPSWVYNSDYWYWTMTPCSDSALGMWHVLNDGSLRDNDVRSTVSFGAVRPVITLYKSAL